MREPTEAAIIADWAAQPKYVHTERPNPGRSYARICFIAGLCCDAVALIGMALLSL